MSKENKKNDQSVSNENISLNDDRRVKVLSPGALVAKRFFRNRTSVVGLAVLIFMFLFSFVGGLISPYDEDQLFYRNEYHNKTYAGVVENTEFRYATAEGQTFDTVVQAQMILALQKGNEAFSYRDINYTVTTEGEDFVSVSLEDGTMIGIAYKDIISSSNEGTSLPFTLQYDALKAFTNGETSFTHDGEAYSIDEGGVVFCGDTEVAYISRYLVNPVMSDVFLSRDFKEKLTESIMNGEEEFYFTDASGVESEYTVTYLAASNTWEVLQSTETRVFDTYSPPSKEH